MHPKLVGWYFMFTFPTPQLGAIPERVSSSGAHGGFDRPRSASLSGRTAEQQPPPVERTPIQRYNPCSCVYFRLPLLKFEAEISDPLNLIPVEQPWICHCIRNSEFRGIRVVEVMVIEVVVELSV